MMQPTERFTTRADNYARYRPGYPAAAIALLQVRCGLIPGATVADLGSGTGILTELLLECGADVFAVEPNEKMRIAAEARLRRYPGFRSVNGSAESTLLAPDSIDLLVAGQAFHWFDAQRSRSEAQRVLRRGAWAALLWNERPAESSPFFADYEALLARHAPEYTRITATHADAAAMRTFFGREMASADFPNQQVLDFEGLKGRLMSSSYAPEPGQPDYQPLVEALRALFRRHARDGHVTMPYRTRVYFAQLATA
jgi:SAM-dependent methyltransferase